MRKKSHQVTARKFLPGAKISKRKGKIEFTVQGERSNDVIDISFNYNGVEIKEYVSDITNRGFNINMTWPYKGVHDSFNVPIFMAALKVFSFIEEGKPTDEVLKRAEERLIEMYEKASYFNSNKKILLQKFYELIPLLNNINKEEEKLDKKMRDFKHIHKMKFKQGLYSQKEHQSILKKERKRIEELSDKLWDSKRELEMSFDEKLDIEDIDKFIKIDNFYNFNFFFCQPIKPINQLINFLL